MVGKQKPSGAPKNKFKQVLLIEGQPKPLYAEYTRRKVSVKYEDKTHRLGYMSSVLVDLLKKIPGAEVIVEEVTTPKTVGLNTVRGLHIRKAKGNTTIEVSAPTREALADKIFKIREELDCKETAITDRCEWICVTDKGHPKVADDSEVPEMGSSDDNDSTASKGFVPKKKSEVGRHGPGKTEKGAVKASPAMKKRIENLREIAKKKGLDGVMKNSPSPDTEMHGN